MAGVRKRLDWRPIVAKAIEATEEFNRRGVKPSIRSIFYWLYSKAIIPNTVPAYKRLSAKLVDARKRGLVPFNAFQDKTRITLGSLFDAVPEADVEEFREKVEEKASSLDLMELLDSYFDGLRPFVWAGRWAGQPTVVEVWIEKEALAPTVEGWLLGAGVTIRVGRGYPSWTFIYSCVSELREVLGRHERVIVLYLGDLDPSGVDIQRFIQEALDYFKLPRDKVVLKRLAVTEEQVRKFGLPPKPEDAATLAKLERDPRMRNYVIDYVVELDALLAYAPDEFRRLVREAVDEYWDEEVYEEMKDEEKRLDEELDEILAKGKEWALKRIREMLGGG